MKELFKRQLANDSVVTEEILDKLNVKKYKNGDDIKIGDKVLFALLTDMPEEMIRAKAIAQPFGTPMERNQEPEEILLELIILNESQFDLYTYDEKFQDKTSERSLPIIRLK